MASHNVSRIGGLQFACGLVRIRLAISLQRLGAFRKGILKVALHLVWGFQVRRDWHAAYWGGLDFFWGKFAPRYGSASVSSGICLTTCLDIDLVFGCES